MSQRRRPFFPILFGADYNQAVGSFCAEAAGAPMPRGTGYDLVLVDGPIKRRGGSSGAAIHWQKLFIPQHPAAARYERIVSSGRGHHD
jgi:hypothetical protein